MIDKINNFRYPVSQPTVFDEQELTVLELVSKVAYKINETVGEINSWIDYLDVFVEAFDKKLQTTVAETLTKWQDSGLLDVIINDALQTQMDILEDETHAKLDLFESHLADMTNNIDNIDKSKIGTQNLPFNYPQKIITAHRGYHRGYLTNDEQTVQALVQSKIYGFNFVELDVRETKDKYLVCCHNNTFKGLKISETNVNDLSDILRFATAVQICNHLGLGITIDIKHDSNYTWLGTYSAVRSYLELYPLQKVVFMGSYEQLKNVSLDFPYHLKILTGRTNSNWTDNELKMYRDASELLAINVNPDRWSVAYNKLLKDNGYKLAIQDNIDNNTRLTREQYKSAEYICTDFAIDLYRGETNSWHVLDLAGGVTPSSIICPPKINRNGKKIYIQGSVNATVSNTLVLICDIPNDCVPSAPVKKVNSTQGARVNRTLVSGNKLYIEWSIDLLTKEYTDGLKWHDITIEYLLD